MSFRVLPFGIPPFRSISRLILAACALSMLSGAAAAGEIVVYTQTWKGTTPHSYTRKHTGKGYIVIDFQNKAVTRISSEIESFQKRFRIENFTKNVFAEYTDYKVEKEALAIQSSRRAESSIHTWERILFLKGKKALVQIGPSQQKQVPKLLAGLRRMTSSYFLGDSLEEDTFTAKIHTAMTNDANANSRTLAEQVELLAGNLEEMGYSRSGTE